MSYHPVVDMDAYGKGSVEPALLREALSRPVEGWSEVQDGFAPVDLETGERMRRLPPDYSGARRAAVLVPIVTAGKEPEVVYTLRRDHLSDHAGQISFPGGSREESDDSLLETALREASEEIDLPPGDVEVVGELEDMYIPPSNFLVRPFVGLLSEEAEFRLSPDEVQEIFSVPLGTLLDPATFQRAVFTREGRRYEVPVFAVRPAVRGRTPDTEYRIWGATAAMTADLLYRLGWRPPLETPENDGGEDLREI